ncbi:MAG: hypothetical protein EBV79_11790, partial [Betaproteobacteria bacterium]|nr:hypothetical protein [Betaproteobacteria bacterium]
MEIVNAQGQVTLYGPEGHPVSTGTVPGLTFNAATKTFSIDTSDEAYNTLTAGQTKTISTHYTVTDQFGTWDEGEVRITVTGDRVYEGGSAKGTLSTGLDQVFIRDTAGDDAVDVNMTHGLRAVGKDSLGRTYVVNWNEVYSSNLAAGTSPTGQVQVHRLLSTGALDTTYEVNLPSDSGELSFTAGIGTSNYKIRGIGNDGVVYVQHSSSTINALEKYVSSSSGIQSGGNSQPVSTRDTAYNVTLDSKTSVIQGTSDGKLYVRSDEGSNAEIKRYNADGTVDTTWATGTSNKLV